MYFLLSKPFLLLLGWYFWPDSGSVVLWNKKLLKKKILHIDQIECNPVGWLWNSGPRRERPAFRQMFLGIQPNLADSVWFETYCCCHHEHMTVTLSLWYLWSWKNPSANYDDFCDVNIRRGAETFSDYLMGSEQISLSGSLPVGLDVPDSTS